MSIIKTYEEFISTKSGDYSNTHSKSLYEEFISTKSEDYSNTHSKSLYEEFTEQTNLLKFSIGVTAFVLGSIIYYVLLQREKRKYT